MYTEEMVLHCSRSVVEIFHGPVVILWGSWAEQIPEGEVAIQFTLKKKGKKEMEASFYSRCRSREQLALSAYWADNW